MDSKFQFQMRMLNNFATLFLLTNGLNLLV